jgi:hypothetical protein
VQSRNVLLTRAGWGVGNGPTPNDTEGARPAGRAEEDQEGPDHPEASGSRNRGERTASAAPAAQLETARRPGGDACKPRPGLQQQDCRPTARASDCNLEPGGIPRLRPDLIGRVFSEETSAGDQSRDATQVDDHGQAVAGQAETNREGAYLAGAAEPLRGAGAMGHQRARLAGRARPQAVSDQHDRRRDQPYGGALCGARLDRGKHAPVRKLRAKSTAGRSASTPTKRACL